MGFRFIMKSRSIIILLLGCLITWPALAQKNQGPSDAQMQQFQKEFQNWMQQSQKLFDQFFQDDFFDDSDVLQEMKNMRQRMMHQLPGSTKDAFNDRFEDWFKGRYGMGTQQFFQEETDKAVKLHILIPGLDKGNVNIKVGEKEVSIEGEVTRQEDRRDFSGKVIGQSLYTSKVHQTIPLPSGIDPVDVKVKKNKDEIVLTIPKVKKKDRDEKVETL